MNSPLPALSTAQKVAAFATMCVGMFIALIDIQIVSASLKDIGGGLSAGADDTAWVQTAYLIAEIIVIPMSGWLSRVMSTRWLFAASAAGFTLTSLLCAMAWNIQSMIAFRALQGFLGGSMIPLVFTTAFMYFNGKQRVIAASTIGAIASLAPTLGPAVGGWITDISSWHWLFYINLLPGLFVTFAVPMLVKVDRPNPSLLKGADYIGMALMAVFLGCLEYTLEEGPRWNWFSDSTISTTAWIAAISGGLFIWRCLEIKEPIVDLRALRDRNFALGCLFIYYRHRHFRHHLPHAAVSRAGARVRLAGYRPGGVFHGGVPVAGDPGVRLAGQSFRPALDPDVRVIAVRPVDVGLLPHHP